MAVATAAPLLEVRGLQTHFATSDGLVRAVDGVSFDVAEGESEIVAGFHVEYSGATFAVLFALPEYANMILIATLSSVFFLGGWLSPLEGVLPSGAFLAAPSFLWLFIKILWFLFCYLWIRATFPRYRYDQIMRLGWKIFIPVTLVWLVVVGLWIQSPWNIWN